jgi:hypothetical protein
MPQVSSETWGIPFDADDERMKKLSLSGLDGLLCGGSRWVDLDIEKAGQVVDVLFGAGVYFS